jgi:hypothetical protein
MARGGFAEDPLCVERVDETLCCVLVTCAGAVAGDGEDSPCQVLYLAPTLCYVLVTCEGKVRGGDIKDYSVRYCTLLPPSAMCWSHVRAR